MLSTLDPKINALVLKWAQNIDGRWSDVVKDLEEYTQQVRKEEKEKILQKAIQKQVT